MNRCSSLFIAVIALVTVPGLVGCGERREAGPPDIRLGDDVCDFCSMIISDQNFAAACVLRQADGRWHTAAFDDIGCLLAFDKIQHDSIEQRYVADYNTGAWVIASQANFVLSPNIRSPMASGIIACQSIEDADELAKRFEGTTGRFDELDSDVGRGAPDVKPVEAVTTQTLPTGPTPPGGADAAHEKSE